MLKQTNKFDDHNNFHEKNLITKINTKDILKLDKEAFATYKLYKKSQEKK